MEGLLIMNRFIKIDTPMDAYESLLKDVIDKYNLTVKISETNPGKISSAINCIEINLTCIGISSNIILIPNNENHNGERGVYELQYILNKAIERHENMSFYKYIEYKHNSSWNDIVKTYNGWKIILFYINTRLNKIHKDEIKGVD